ncbi:MAG: O-antigen ligase family protein [Candidatus Zixiibacteriota bacterium]
MTGSTSVNRIATSPAVPGLLALSPFLAALAAAIGMMAIGRMLVAILLLAGAVAVALTLLPRISFYLFMGSMAVWLPQQVTMTFAVHVFDFMLAVLFAGVAVEFLLKSNGEIRSTGYDLAFLALIAATLISAILAYRPVYSIVPVVRIATIYIAFRVFYKYGEELGVRRVLTTYVGIVTLLSVYNFVKFIAHGGQIRVFGLAELGYEPMSMTALPMALAFLLWANRFGERFWYGVVCVLIAAGIFATQARGPLLTVMLATPVLLWFTWRKAKREQNHTVVRSARLVTLGMILLAVVTVSLSTNLLANAWGRYQEFIVSLGDPEGTIALRLVLWRIALRTFMDNPLVGIGIGNFRIVHEIYPDLRVIPLHLQVKGMSAHNVLLHYLAETGLAGTLSLLTLTWLGLRNSYRTYRERFSTSGTQVSAALFIALLVFALTLLYMRAWTWGEGGYVMALLFGVGAAWNRPARRS